MQKNAAIEFDEWLERARKEGEQFTVDLLHSYRDYLRLLARMQLSKVLSVRVSPSDIVQESLLAAKTAFAGFKGTTEAELLTWLRRVLASRIVDALRFH